MNILVAGGAGFLGTNLILKLLEDENNKVWCIDNFVTGQHKNVSLYEHKKNFMQLIYCNISSCEDMFFVNQIQSKLDVVYNFACPASPKAYQENALLTLDTCYLGTKNLLELSLKHSAVYVHASTSEVYGDPEIDVQHEQYRGNVNTFGSRACYDEGKRVAETLCYEYHKKGANIKIGRIFNTYGPHMSKNDGRVVSNFITQALCNQNITIYGDGSQTRSLCYVDDLIDAFIALSKSCIDITGPINLGNDDELTIVDIANTIVKLTNSTSELVYYTLPEDDPKQRKPDIKLAKTLLNWYPKCDVNNGLLRTIGYFKTII